MSQAWVSLKKYIQQNISISFKSKNCKFQSKDKKVLSERINHSSIEFEREETLKIIKLERRHGMMEKEMSKKALLINKA